MNGQAEKELSRRVGIRFRFGINERSDSRDSESGCFVTKYKDVALVRMVARPKFSLAGLLSWSPPPSSHRMGTPFSIVEFGNLVALALETSGPDRFSESFLQFDPELGCGHIKAPGEKGQTSDKMTSGWSDSTPSRPRRLFEKLKHKASALVLRTTCPSPPKVSRAIFSRPASLVTAPPPSPTRSFSSTSSASPVTPTTDVDVFARPSTSPCSPNNSRWSLSTDESTTSSYPSHPFASTHDVTSQDADPFAKGRVQVIRTSADYPSYTYAFAKRRSQPRINVQPPTAKPPDWTLALPVTPPRSLSRSPSFLSHSSASDSSLCPSAWTPPSPPRSRRKTRVLLPTASPRPTTSTPTLRQKERERARALAVLNGEVHPRALEAFARSDDARSTADSEQAYYSARSSFAGDVRSQRPAPPRLAARPRVDSQVRPVGC